MRQHYYLGEEEASSSNQTSRIVRRGRSGPYSLRRVGRMENPLRGAEPELSQISDRHPTSNGRPARTPRCRAQPNHQPVGLLSAMIGKILPTSPHILKPQNACPYYAAFRFEYESPRFCCSLGEVKICVREAPQELLDLIHGTDEDSENFRTFLRVYNNVFACASLGGRITTETFRKIYSFTLHGQIYHYLPDLIPDQNNPKYLQLYFYDSARELQLRSSLFDQLRETVIAKLMKILESNPYAQFFRSLCDQVIDESTTIKINHNPVLDQRVFNAPTSSEVAAILLDSSMSSESEGPYITVSGRSSKTHRLKHHYGCYDPLTYPLLFPYGESRWHSGIPKCARKTTGPPMPQYDPVQEAVSA